MSGAALFRRMIKYNYPPVVVRHILHECWRGTTSLVLYQTFNLKFTFQVHGWSLTSFSTFVAKMRP